MIQSISRERAEKIIQEMGGNSNFEILDIRTPGEFYSGAIPTAKNIDFYSPGFSEQLKDLDKNKTYLIYCRSGNRSKSALSIMAGMGFTNIFEIDEGLLG